MAQALDRSYLKAHDLSSELLRFSVLLSYPKLICAGISSNFLVQIFLPRRGRTAAAEVRACLGTFAEIQSVVAREAGRRAAAAA
jgi:hypothetical protein